MNGNKFIIHKKFLEQRYNSGTKVAAKFIVTPAIVLVKVEEGIMCYHVVAKKKDGTLECAIIEDGIYIDGYQVNRDSHVLQIL